MSEHVPDINKIPHVIRGLPWIEPPDSFFGGSQFLVAVPIREVGGFRYTFHVVTASVDDYEDEGDNLVSFMVDGEDWDMDEADFVVQLS